MKTNLLSILLGLMLLLGGGLAAWFLILSEPEPGTIGGRGPKDGQNEPRRNSTTSVQGANSGQRDSADHNTSSDTTPVALTGETRNPSSADPSPKDASVKPKPPSGKSQGSDGTDTTDGTDTPAPSELSEEEKLFAELDAVEPQPIGAAIYGRVTLEDGSPASDVSVHLVLRSAHGFNSVAMARTESDGMYAIGARELLIGVEGVNTGGTGFTPAPVHPGNYQVEARVRGAAMTAVSAQLGKSLVRKDIKLDPDRVVTITLECTNSDGRGVSQPQVTLIHRDGGYGGATSSRFSTAGVSMGGVPAPLRVGESQTSIPAAPVRNRPELYTLAAKAMRHVELRIVQPAFRCIDPPGGIVTLDLSDGEDRTLKLRFEPLEPGKIYEDPSSEQAGSRVQVIPTGEASIRGRITIGFATALLLDTSVALERVGYRAREVKVDPVGEFRFEGLSEGEYTLKLTNPNFSSKPTRLLQVRSRGEEFVEWEVRTDRLKLVFESQGASYDGGIFQLKSEAKGQMAYEQLQTGVPLREWPVTEGLYWAEISSAGAVIGTAEADASFYFDIPGSGGNVTHTLPIVKSGSVRYQITDGQGYGWTGAEVRLVREAWFVEGIEPMRKAGEPINWQRTKLGTTDSIGKGRIEALPPGRYKMLIWTSSRDPNRWDRTVTVDVVGGQDVDVGRFGGR